MARPIGGPGLPRLPVRLPRTSRRVPAVVVALVVLAVAVIAMVDLIAALVGPAPVVVDWPAVTRWLTRHRFDDLAALVVAIVAAVLGLLLVVVAFTPGRLRVRRLPGDDRAKQEDAQVGLVVAAPPATVRATVRAAVLDVPGVSAASVDLRRRSLAVTARTPRRIDDDLHRAVETAARERLAAIGADEIGTVSVALRAAS